MASSGAGASSKNKGKGKVVEHYPYDDDFENMVMEEMQRQQYYPTENSNQQYVVTDEEERQCSEEEEGEEACTMTMPKRKQTHTSDIFTVHFTKKQKDDNTFEVICNYCKKSYKFKLGGGYGTFKRHLEQKHPSKVGIDKSQSQISGYASSKTSSQHLFQYSDNKNKEELAKMISNCHLSFSFGENTNFVRYCQNALNPSAKRIPRNTLKRSIFHLYNKGKNDLQILFSNLNGRVSICSDIWSDHWQRHSYMGITCHWIDNEWNIQKRLIAYRAFNDRHTASNIYKLMKTILEEYKIVHKIFSVSFDNAAANTASISDLKTICQPNVGGKFFHVRCACHVLNLCVQDGLKSLDTYISPIRKAISYLWVHPQVRKEWFKFCKINDKYPKKFSSDVPTRWNSTYHMLQESYEYKELLCSFFDSHNSNMLIFPQSWDNCVKLLEILKIFDDATHVFSGVYYPTSHLLMNECYNIAYVLSEYANDDILATCIFSMTTKWLNYFKIIPPIFLVAVVFDPRCKFEMLTDYLTGYYSYLNDNEINVSKMIEEVRKDVLTLYYEFSTLYGDPVGASKFSCHQVQNEPSSKIKPGDRLLLQKRQRPALSGGSTTELDVYLTTIFEFGDNSTGKDFPILEWWSRHANTFPVLAQMAKHILATPVSTVAVEQAFSAGGNILDAKRSNLTPEALEAQVCLADWGKAEVREQDLQEQESEEYDTSTTIEDE